MKNSSWVLCVLLTIGVIALCTLMASIATDRYAKQEIEKAREEFRAEAVKAGAGCWKPDEKGKPKFEWIVPVEKKQ